MADPIRIFIGKNRLSSKHTAPIRKSMCPNVFKNSASNIFIRFFSPQTYEKYRMVHKTLKKYQPETLDFLPVTVHPYL
ncbi:hypothetical protein Barb6_01976 [Bacteroidales bacterium Barb6]|nr:hypothetical protein Barb6_01976 [Bacteroidales bacterium Barb6]